MKKLLYKEIMLSIHPVCYVFALGFPLLCLIPNFPIFVGTLYVVPAFSFLFLGAQKGKQTNDLFYSALLPIRKQDIVKARMISAVLMEFATLIMLAILTPIKIIIEQSISGAGGESLVFTTQGIVTSFAFAIIGYAIVNTIFFLMFYKKGRSIMAPTMISVFTYLIIILVFTSVLPAIDPLTGQALVPSYYNALYAIDIGYQFIYLVVAIVIYFIVNFFVMKEASKRLLKADL